MPKTLGKFQVIKALGEGANSKVKLVKDPQSKKCYAAKIFKSDVIQSDPQFMQTMQNEVNVMKKINHKYLVNFIDVEINGVYTKKDGTKKKVIYIVLELAEGGELFDFIAQSGPFSEKVCRFFFKQMCEALDDIHKHGVCHRDLKPENVLLDKNFNIKIADFGFGAPTDGKEHQGYLRTRLGTLNYMAPEIHQKKPYSGPSVDVFAASIILFIMLTQHPPFNTAQPNDGFYKCIAANRSDLFWKSHIKTKPSEEFFSDDFKRLIQSCMQLDESHRPNFLEILHHPWMKGATATHEEIVKEFAYRKQHVDQVLEQERQQKQQEKQAQNKPRMYRSGDHTVLEKEIEQEIEESSSITKFMTTMHPDQSQKIIMDVISKNDAKVEMAKNKYKFTCAMKGQSKQDDGTQDGKTIVWEQDFQIKIFKMKTAEPTYSIEFLRKGGNQLQFQKVFQLLRSHILAEFDKSMELDDAGQEQMEVTQ